MIDIGQAYKIGLQSQEQLRKALRQLWGDDVIPSLAAYLQASARRSGGLDCKGLWRTLVSFLSYYQKKWVMYPEGVPPSLKLQLTMRVLCSEGLPLIEDFLIQLASQSSDIL